MNKYTIDRFEGNIAVLLKKGEETVEKDVPVSSFTEEVNEGDIVEEITSGNKNTYRPLREETKSRRQEAEDLLTRIKNKNDQ
ncbi:DUF3006 domain-containing protein [Salimicrobium album]|uniref:DUF3006 domain-containing protein n=1 Tax=Salimicrobium album TaxID=50717 RepID=A0A1H3IE31_9BACI|nr:DUF3006 domain-containing protein [Salimicrobium album]SDY26113.1 Protein of unknown function [Salimicrobium album]